MDDQRVTVHQVSSREVCRPILIFQALSNSFRITILILAFLGVAITPIGWIAMQWVFVSNESLVEGATNYDAAFSQVVEMNRSPYKSVSPDWQLGESLSSGLSSRLQGVELVFASLTKPLFGAMSLSPGLSRFCYFLGGGLWTLLVWSFFGCAITRVALMQYTRDERIGIDDAFDYAFEKFWSCFGGAAIPLLAIAGLTIPLALLGLLMATNIGLVIGGLVWIVVLVFALLITIIVLLLAVGWPLIVSAISCDGQDSFDGMSRAFGYLFQRPLLFLAYAILGILFSAICWMVANIVVNGAIQTSYWATSWGSNITSNRTAVFQGKDATASVGNDQTGNPSDESGTGAEGQTPVTIKIGRGLIQFWNGVAKTIGAAFLYGLFWCVAAAIYLLLRKELDDTELDEIYLADERRTYELPPLREDHEGIPQVDEDSVLPATVEPPSESDGSENESPPGDR